MGQQVSGVLVVHSDIVVRKQAWEKVVDLSGNVQNKTHSAKKPIMLIFTPLPTDLYHSRKKQNKKDQRVLKELTHNQVLICCDK